ncbi:MAG: hypothetical protein AOA66_0096 [Candidatus Bathyarchaeota archaeon BA2]|nr:MAG: hypothetical protein AOA66_0096 [Candidatus Bathyarchaeota archaeon BA2]
MGHVHVDAYIKGTKGELKLQNVLVDTGATYTMFSMNLLDEVGAIKTSYTLDLELGDGRKVKAEVYVAAIRIEDREGPAIVATFKDVKQVLGTQTLESLGLKVDPSTGRLEPTRPKGVAYFY